MPFTFPFGEREGWEGLTFFRDVADFSSSCFHGEEVSIDNAVRQGKVFVE
jgi:hypothetical protein